MKPDSTLLKSNDRSGSEKVIKPLKYSTQRGFCRPFGATPFPGGVNFAVFSRHATALSLVLFKEGAEDPVAEIILDPTQNKTGDVWHVFVLNLPSDMLYGYRLNGAFAPKAGHRFSNKAIVLDPFDSMFFDHV